MPSFNHLPFELKLIIFKVYFHDRWKIFRAETDAATGSRDNLISRPASWRVLLRQLCALAMSSVTSLALLTVVFSEATNKSKERSKLLASLLDSHHLDRFNLYLAYAQKISECEGGLSKAKRQLEAYMSRLDQDEVREAQELAEAALVEAALHQKQREIDDQRAGVERELREMRKERDHARAARLHQRNQGIST